MQQPPRPRLLHHALELRLVPLIAGVPYLEVIATLSRYWGHAENNNIILFGCFETQGVVSTVCSDGCCTFARQCVTVR